MGSQLALLNPLVHVLTKLPQRRVADAARGARAAAGAVVSPCPQPRGASFWVDAAPAPPQHPQLDGDVNADVAVIGGGIVGITTALLLPEARRAASSCWRPIGSRAARAATRRRRSPPSTA